MKTKKKRFFSVELKSKRNLKNTPVTKDPNDNVLPEGNTVELVQPRFAEDAVLEIIGKNSTLRINVEEDKIKPENKLPKVKA